MNSMLKRILFSLILLAGVILAGFHICQDRKAGQTEISEHVLRLHIRADSNSVKDQDLKMKVRDAVLQKMSEFQDEITNVENAKTAVISHLDELQESAETVVKGYDKKIEVMVGQSWFPQKAYGDVVLPEGDYESVIVKIGSGEGRNWWCVLFPQLCFIDPVNGYVPEQEKTQLKEALSEETYDMLIDKRVEAKFKIVEWIREQCDF